MLMGEPAIVTLHDSTGAQIGQPQVVELGLPPWPRRTINWLLRRPTQYENREPIEWDWSKGDIPAGVTVSSIRVTTPYWVQEYDATGPPQ
jgi:hypothetical protein